MSDRLTAGQLLRRLVPYWRRSAVPTAGGIALLLVAGALELAQPWPIKWLVDSVFDHRPLPDSLVSISPRLTADALKENPASGVVLVVAMVLILALAHKVTQLFSQYLLVIAGSSLVQRLRDRVIDHVHRQTLRFHDSSKVGDLIYRAAYDSYAAQAILSGAVAPVLSGVVILIGILVVMLRLDWQLTLAALTIIPTLWFLTRAFGRAIERRSKSYHEHQASFYSMLTETLSSIRVVQAFTAEDRVAKRVGQETEISRVRMNRLTFVQLLFTCAVGIAMAGGTAAVIYLGATRVLSGGLTIGELLVFLAYLGMLYTPITAFTQSSATVQTAGTQLQRVFELLDAQPEISSPPRPLVPASAAGGWSFENIDFGYDADRPVLSGINLAVEPGSVVAIVGRTGSGKSSLVSLLPRFYDPQRGRVLLDGNDLRDLDLNWLRRQIAFVLQDPVLFSGTIRENITFGCDDATEQQIRTAAEDARALEFIERLPDGFDTMLGERGINLSGGQRQRLAIARAFLRDAPVLILDEPTSALDATTESELLQSVDRLMGGRTTFVIAHRLSTIRNADVIWVLDQGTLVQQGTHEELLQQAGAYQSLCESQFGSQRTTAIA